MSTYKTQGVVIKRKNINEADRLLTIITEKHGKIVVIAKGARRTLSKLGSHLEPYNLVDFVLAEGRSFDTVTGASVNKYFTGIHQDLNKMARAFRFGELLDFLMHDRQEHRKIFKLLDDCLNYLDSSEGSVLADLYFFVNCLSDLGYCPELHECVFCRVPINPNIIGWDNEHGGVVCQNCLKSELTIDSQVVKLMRLLLKQEIGLLDRLTLNEDSSQQAEEILIGFIGFINQRELGSDRFIKDIKLIDNMSIGNN